MGLAQKTLNVLLWNSNQRSEGGGVLVLLYVKLEFIFVGDDAKKSRKVEGIAGTSLN